jgi:ketosteroid isomerase-like protein
MMTLGGLAERRQFFLRILLVALAFALSAGMCQAQKKNKNGQGNNSTDTPATTQPQVATGPDSEQIDNAIGEVLAGFQLGNTDLMHKHYADSATFVSGAYAPPVLGWQNYLPIYQSQRANFQSVQILRRNTFIFTHGDVAWASYQWQFDGTYNDRPYSAQGQTTLVLNKVGQNWMIVHNHTSQICPENAPASAPQTAPKP